MKTPLATMIIAVAYAALQICAYSYVADCNELPNGTVRPKTYQGWHYVDRYVGPLWLGHAAGSAVAITVDEGSSTSWTLPYVSYADVTIQQTSGTATGRYNWWTEMKDIIKEVIPLLHEMMPSFIIGM